MVLKIKWTSEHFSGFYSGIFDEFLVSSVVYYIICFDSNYQTLSEYF